MAEGRAERILVRGVNWLGDAVMTLPALHAIRTAYPEASISLLVKPSVAPLFEKSPDVDEVILYEDRFRSFGGRLRLALLLRKKRFSKAILLQNAFDAALIVFLSGIPERIGYDRDGRGFLLTKRVPFNNDDRSMHHIHYYLQLLRAAGIEEPYAKPWIHIDIAERIAARERLASLPRPVLGIHPGATFGSSKRWLPERFAEVARWFISETGGSAVIFGSPAEVDTAQEIIRLIPRNRMSLAGKTKLREFMAIIAECDVMLTNDSGPMHVSYGAGTPLVAIFGSTSPELTGPPVEGGEVIRAEFDCSPCFDRTCSRDFLWCMHAIEAEDTYSAVRRLLGTQPAVFFDRDGTLCRDADYLGDWKDFELLPGIEDLAVLRQRGFLLIGVSNQSGIARGLVREEFVQAVNSLFVERHGFADFFYCPHLPGDRCACRKPQPGMAVAARARHKVDFRRSFVVGDKDDDMLFAKAIGARGVLVRTGKQQGSDLADIVVDDLEAAVQYIARWKK